MAKKLSKQNALADKFADCVTMGKVKNVTAADYPGKATAVAAKRGGKEHGVCICPIENPREWGAWLSYFKHIDKNVKFMQYLGKTRANDRSATRMWVPTPMPYQFDADRLEITDRSASDVFEAAQKKARDDVAAMGTPEQRLAQAQAAIKRVRDACRPPNKPKHTTNKVPSDMVPDKDSKRWRDPEELRKSAARLRKLGKMEEDHG